ncbi:hypothetical protein MCOR27_004103 [Pyricularia oryzae]|uniref:AB hydrolase-1 domain-containing protein n=2 Tax=Pyricularia TaxID=48558 RepID=A0ABQ8NY41_PYRGI|nr:hypothetical protein MCOR01_009311 [Pyricularia oryzae]KAI6303791.1 hypothetical protein MCOR33_001143 [Pyricularia grisea]KAH9437437.1 hypothetical protein MCOR02_001094 [Pyricularia oryzae]KAI6259451.1 hypothetical protein MCOR19_004188 [Pyricularia oryzae]KAI6280462.1 hypothetical protein MCOR26_003702 [Pyricularia oryzae]
MAPVPDVQLIEFKTLDGLTLRGSYYATLHRAPAVIMTPGFNWPREFLVTDVALQFQLAGINALVFDPRCIGASDGLPRNDNDPWAQIGDYHDAVTWIKAQPTVDPAAVGLWGYSMSGILALSAAAVDVRRVKFAMAVCPACVFSMPSLRTVLAKAMQDRESRLRGNEPYYVSTLDRHGFTPGGLKTAWDTRDIERLEKMIEDGKAMGVSSTATIQSYARVPFFDPRGAFHLLEGRPVLVISGAQDSISPLEVQKDWLLSRLPEPKEHHVEPDGGHMDMLSGEIFPKIMEVQLEFLRDQLGVDL